MHLNEVGNFCVMWKDRDGMVACAFFHTLKRALVFRDATGGDVYSKEPSGELKRA